MRTFGISRVHNSSVSILEDGDLTFHLENERLSNIKYDGYPFHVLESIKHIPDHICLAGVGKTPNGECFSDDDMYSIFIKHRHANDNIETHDFWNIHHKLHAAHAFYNSGFDEALCIVKDGMGSEVKLNNKNFLPGSYGREISSTFLASYPDNFIEIDKHIAVPFECNMFQNGIRVSNNLSEAMAFQIVSKHFGFHSLDAGKVMGMSSYGKLDSNIPPIYKDGFINNELFSLRGDLRKSYLNVNNFPYLKGEEEYIKFNLAYKLQKETQEEVGRYILKMIEKTGCKNVCLSGGFFLNCVANYYYLSILPKNINLYIEPVSNDAGTSIGAAKYFWHSKTKSTDIKKLNSLYLGGQYNIPKEGKPTSYEEVCNLLISGKIVAIYQGRSESGPRALGNRSILFDPRNPNAKDIINRIKRREWFRPFAGTIIEEYASQYFDMRGLNESPFMMYAVKVLTDKIPGITHIDNTCRIQTVNQNQNNHFYNLILKFYEKTGIPILFNTSFNLAGECMVETPDDAIKTLRKSEIDYLYFPENQTLME